ncbi:uncharacterized protein EV420DRAFT_1485452 [Desarmillaria tabescens]|uniref:Uncharacterized protein n=1 Tax=Armillaria tabescens TaxID=1929756 RepID=A0AA39JHR8_ARMTA|nr:uncharacterized protein EV420DRAFT_1485452 [Desarmillaria tabescens]KAK0442016.1 hypothetical protein EV420DRAFT_1485452 [Desarmillaria tabescens]
MPCSLSVDQWIQAVKLAAAAGEMVPIPYLKGAAQSAVIILQAIEKAGKNDEDLQKLGEDIGATICIVKEAIDEHGITNATHFCDVCTDLQTYLENLLEDLRKTQPENKLKHKRFKRFLKTKKVSDAINEYKQKMKDIKDNYVVRGITNLQLEIPAMRDVLSTEFTEATEKSRSCMASTIDSRTEQILGEIRSLEEGHITQVSAELKEVTHYKGAVMIWIRVIPGLKNTEYSSISKKNRESKRKYYSGFFAEGDINLVKRAPPPWQDSDKTIQLLIRIYKPSVNHEQEALKRLDRNVDAFIKPRHLNIPQVYGVCVIKALVQEFMDGLTVKEFVPFYIKFRATPKVVTSQAKYHSGRISIEAAGQRLSDGAVHYEREMTKGTFIQENHA